MTDFRATSTVKIFVGNLSKSTSNDKIRELFETYGAVAEADVLGEFGFVVSYYLGQHIHIFVTVIIGQSEGSGDSFARDLVELYVNCSYHHRTLFVS